MGRSSSWNHRGTKPLRIPKVFYKTGEILFKGLDSFVATSEDQSESFASTFSKEGDDCLYHVELVITRLEIEPTISAIAPSPEPIESPSDTATEFSPEEIALLAMAAEPATEPEPQFSPEEIELLAMAAEDTRSMFSEKAITNPTENLIANKTKVEAEATVDISSADSVVVEQAVKQPQERPKLAGITFPAMDLTEFGNQVYNSWHRLAENEQLPVWGRAVELDDIYRYAFRTMPGSLFLTYLQKLIEQENVQKVARIGLVNIPGKQNFPVGDQSVCALTFWSDWHLPAVEVNDQPAKILPRSTALLIAIQQQQQLDAMGLNAEQEPIAQNSASPVTSAQNSAQNLEGEMFGDHNQTQPHLIAQFSELNSLPTGLGHSPDYALKIHSSPATPTSTLDRLRAERQQHLQEIGHPTSVQNSRNFVRNSRKATKPFPGGLVAGFLGLFQKATS